MRVFFSHPFQRDYAHIPPDIQRALEPISKVYPARVAGSFAKIQGATRRLVAALQLRGATQYIGKTVATHRDMANFCNTSVGSFSM